MARQRFRRKDLKRPDQFVSSGQRFLAWAVDNRTQLTRIGVGVGIVVLLGGGYIGLRSSRAQQANTDLGRALRSFAAGNYATAAAQLTNVAERWPSTAAGSLAPLYAASAALKAGNDDEAEESLAQLSVSDLPPYLQQEVTLLEGFASEAAGELNHAALQFHSAAETDGPYTALALLGEARTREALGQPAEARALYERLLQEFPQAQDAEFVEAKLEELAA